MISRRVISIVAVGAAILLAAGCAGTTARQPTAASAAKAPSAQLEPFPSHRATPRSGPDPTRPPRPAFSATVSGPLTPEDVPFSWRPGCPVPPGQLRAIYLSYAGFDGRAHTGQIIVNASVVHQVIEVFSLLYRARFPISRMEPVDVFHGSDPRSMAADNTSGFNCRSAVASGPPRWSMHAYGLAIDVNTIQKSSAARRVTGHRTDKAGKRIPERVVLRADNPSIPSPEPSTESAIRAPPGQERGHTRSLALFGGSAPGPPERGPDLLSGCPGHAEPALKGIPRLPAAPGQVAVSPASPPSRRR